MSYIYAARMTASPLAGCGGSRRARAASAVSLAAPTRPLPGEPVRGSRFAAWNIGPFGAVLCSRVAWAIRTTASHRVNNALIRGVSGDSGGDAQRPPAGPM